MLPYFIVFTTLFQSQWRKFVQRRSKHEFVSGSVYHNNGWQAWIGIWKERNLSGMLLCALIDKPHHFLSYFPINFMEWSEHNFSNRGLPNYERWNFVNYQLSTQADIKVKRQSNPEKSCILYYTKSGKNLPFQVEDERIFQSLKSVTLIVGVWSGTTRKKCSQLFKWRTQYVVLKWFASAFSPVHNDRNLYTVRPQPE